jgi:branched-chain amino acid transport system permease protein
MLAILVIVLLVTYRIRYSKLGYSLLALGEDEDAVEVLGVNSQASKLKALVIYAFICGVVGGLYASFFGYIHPSFFDTNMSMEVAILGIVGGMGFIYGPALAAIIMVSFREMLRVYLGSQLAGLYLAVYAVILILVALYQPRGFAPLIDRAVKSIRSSIEERRHGRTADLNTQ